MKHFLFLLLALPLVLVSCNPDEDDNELSGCMDPDALNFSANATVDDDSCVYGELSGCGGVSTVTYDGYTYDLVAIGDQCWFAENLRTTQYADGSSIPEVTDGTAWSGLNDGARCAFNNDASNLATYGYLYNWYAVDDVRGLCPTGWHVPTDGEFMTLEMELGMSESEANGTGWRGTNQGTQMKSSASDSPAWNGTNTSGFSGLAGGGRDYYGVFESEGYYGFFWSASASGTYAWARRLNGGDTEVRRKDDPLRFGFSVRCVRD